MSMKIIVPRAALALALARTMPVVKSQMSTLAVLGYVRLTARRSPDSPNPEDGEVVVEASNLDLTITTVAACRVVSEGVLLVGGARLHDVVRAISADEVSLQGEANHYATLRGGKASTRLPGMPPDGFPTLPAWPDSAQMTALPTAQLLSLIESVAYAISTDEGRPSLNGALLQTSGPFLRAASTDGHRLSLWLAGQEVSPENFHTGKALKAGIIVPRGGLGAIKGILDVKQDTTRLCVEDGRLFVRHGHTTVGARLLEGSFPNVEQILPGEPDEGVLPSLSKAQFMAALRYVAIVAPPKTGNVRVTIERVAGEGVVEVYTHDSERGEARETIPCNVPEGCKLGPDGRLAAGFNYHYLLDALATLQGDDVTLLLVDTLSPVLLRAVGPQRATVLAVVMPMRI
jgi:DNA polymerase-3 subunit beta